jgi:subtilase family serine protease
VWRDTHAPYWQHSRDVGNVTRATIKGVSKDNVIFGVQAVDKDGNASMATYPVPQRVR